MATETLSIDYVPPALPAKACACQVPPFSITSSVCSGCGLPEKRPGPHAEVVVSIDGVPRSGWIGSP